MEQISTGISGRNLLSPQNEDLELWMNLYFENFDTSSSDTRKIKKRAFRSFLDFLKSETGTQAKSEWTPRFSSLYIKHLKNLLNEKGRRVYSNRTINNNFTPHLKHLAKYIGKFSPWISGDPSGALKKIPTSTTMLVERAISPAEKRKILDLADAMRGWPEWPRGAMSPKQRAIVTKSFRPYRDRAICIFFV